MAIITIKDLPDNIELDRQALQAIVGGARGGRAGVWRDRGGASFGAFGFRRERSAAAPSLFQRVGANRS